MVIFVEICPIGFQFDSDKKVCVGCLLGYYKDTGGNAEDCKKCPVNKTTEFANSTTINACSAGKSLYSVLLAKLNQQLWLPLAFSFFGL